MTFEQKLPSAFRLPEYQRICAEGSFLSAFSLQMENGLTLPLICGISALACAWLLSARQGGTVLFLIFVLLAGYVASIVGLLIGWLSEKGYNLLKGKQGKGKVVILIIAIVFGVVLGVFAADAISVAQVISETEGAVVTYADIPAFLLALLMTDGEYRSATLSNILLGLLFAGLGVFALLRKAGKEVADTKVVDLP